MQKSIVDWNDKFNCKNLATMQYRENTPSTVFGIDENESILIHGVIVTAMTNVWIASPPSI